MAAQYTPCGSVRGGTSTPENTYSLGVDFLTITAPAGDGDFRRLVKVASGIEDRKVKKHKWRRFGYEIEQITRGCSVGVSSKRELLQLSGQIADIVFPLIGGSLPSVWKVTRLDIRCDIAGARSLEQFSKWISGMRELQRHTDWKITEWKTSSEIETAYLHMPNCLIRCYQKHIQMKEENPRVRLELQFKPQSACNTSNSILISLNSGRDLSQTLLACIGMQGFTIIPGVLDTYQEVKHQYKPVSEDLEWLRTVARNYVLSRGITKEELCELVYGSNEEVADEVERRIISRRAEQI
jgi:hypothetical protein